MEAAAGVRPKSNSVSDLLKLKWGFVLDDLHPDNKCNNFLEVFGTKIDGSGGGDNTEAEPVEVVTKITLNMKCGSINEPMWPYSCLLAAVKNAKLPAP